MTDSLRETLEAAYEETTNDTPVVSEQNPSTEQNNEEAPPENETPPEPELEAPSHWAFEDREVFKALDAKGREFLLRRHKQTEADYTRKSQALSEDVKIAENYRKKLTPHEGYIKQIGIDPFEAFEKLVGAEIKLRTGTPAEKQEMLQNLAKQYGVQFNADNATQPEVDEKTKFILQKIQQQEHRLLQWEKEKEETERRSLQTHINNFSSQVDEKGLPKYPHFETIKADMGLLLKNGKAESLEDAYEQALFLNKDLRNEYIARHTKNVEVKNKTLASKAAGFNVKSASTSQVVDTDPPLNLRKQLERAWDATHNKRF